jgi:tetratricopeptide (TPR) repeat protein
VELAPKALDYRSLRGNALARLGRYDEAAQEFAAAVRPQTELGLGFAMMQAFAHLGARDLDAYRDLRATLVHAIQNSEVGSNRLEVAWLGALVPDSVDGFEDLVKSVREEVAETKLHPDKNDPTKNELDSATLGTLGAVLYRLGRYEDAVRTLTESSAKLDQGPDQNGQYLLACGQYFLAMARHQLGHEFQSRRCLDEACATDQALQNDPTLDWRQRVVLNTLHREAKGLIEP